jgi:TPR repeat protein
MEHLRVFKKVVNLQFRYILPCRQSEELFFGFIFFSYRFIKKICISRHHMGEKMNRCVAWLAALFLLSAYSIVHAGYDEGVAAINHGDYFSAYNEFKALADQGDARAQNRVGVMNDIGQGIPQNYSEALRWYRMAAEQGLVDAQYNLALMYIKGKGVMQDTSEAMKWLLKAAEHGQPRAQNTLGYMYTTGQGIPQNYAEAEKWYRHASDQGFAPAQCNLGLMYLNGQGVPQDLVLAHMWFNLAVTGGYADAQKWRDSVAAKLTPSQLSEAQSLATKWYTK